MASAATCCCVLPARRACVVIGAVLTAVHAVAGVALAGAALYFHLSERIHRRRPAALAVAAGLTLLALVFQALLLAGARRDRPPLLLAWLVFSGLWYSAQMAGLAVGLVTATAVRDWGLLVGLVALCAAQALLWHWFLVVRSQYMQLRLNARPPRRGTTDETDGGQEKEKMPSDGRSEKEAPLSRGDGSSTVDQKTENSV
ncbi:hypothetical protein FJT64_012482 [Amphibalanus amphitrite]|uniref:Uncharacterized protein n=1 Tax=Amphibalanus amphitrite TaxID=1232801 RepID=A0A6A4VD86_AMPAM|nr:hypothetical protein FJT64_012482 [Amphibalanus amphitrite]